MSSTSIPTRQLNLAQQLFSLQRMYPNGKGSITRAVLRWQNELAPTPLSRSYRTALTYRLQSAPQTHVISPSLVELAGGRRIPHLYSQEDQRLCLYLPGAGAWDSSKFTAGTIVPWALLWLFYFEEWLLSDEWKGGGVHPPSKDRLQTFLQ